MIQAVNLFKTLLPSCLHASCLRACWLRGSWSGKNLLMRKLSPKHARSPLLGPPDVQGQVFPSMDSMSFDPPEGRQLAPSLDDKRPPLRKKGSRGLAWGAILWLSSLDEVLVHNCAKYGHTKGICVVKNQKHIWKHLIQYIFHRSGHETPKTSVHQPPEKTHLFLPKHLWFDLSSLKDRIILDPVCTPDRSCPEWKPFETLTPAPCWGSWGRISPWLWTTLSLSFTAWQTKTSSQINYLR